MGPKVKEEAPTTLEAQVEAKTKALKAKKMLLKDICNHKKKKRRICMSPNFPGPNTLHPRSNLIILVGVPPGEMSFTLYHH